MKQGVINVVANAKVIAANKREVKLQKENITLDKIQFGSMKGGAEAIGRNIFQMFCKQKSCQFTQSHIAKLSSSFYSIKL